jgi:hypothetical protein
MIVPARGMGQTGYITPDQAMTAVSWFPYVLGLLVVGLVFMQRKGR